MNDFYPTQKRKENGETEHKNPFESYEDALAFYHDKIGRLAGLELGPRKSSWSRVNSLDSWEHLAEAGNALGVPVDIDDFAIRHFWDREKNEPQTNPNSHWNAGLLTVLDDLQHIRELGAVDPILTSTTEMENLAISLSDEGALSLILAETTDEAFDYLVETGLDLQKLTRHILDTSNYDTEWSEILSEENVRERLEKNGVQLDPKELLEKTAIITNADLLIENLDFFTTKLTPQDIINITTETYLGDVVANPERAYEIRWPLETLRKLIEEFEEQGQSVALDIPTIVKSANLMKQHDNGDTYVSEPGLIQWLDSLG